MAFYYSTLPTVFQEYVDNIMERSQEYRELLNNVSAFEIGFVCRHNKSIEWYRRFARCRTKSPEQLLLEQTEQKKACITIKENQFIRSRIQSLIGKIKKMVSKISLTPFLIKTVQIPVKNLFTKLWALINCSFTGATKVFHGPCFKQYLNIHYVCHWIVEKILHVEQVKFEAVYVDFLFLTPMSFLVTYSWDKPSPVQTTWFLWVSRAWRIDTEIETRSLSSELTPSNSSKMWEDMLRMSEDFSAPSVNARPHEEKWQELRRKKIKPVCLKTIIVIITSFCEHSPPLIISEWVSLSDELLWIL